MKADISTIICFGYRKINDKKSSCVNAWDYKETWNTYKNDDYHLVKFAHDLLQDVDLIVTHNGKKFDIKFLNTRIAYHKHHGRKDKKLNYLPIIEHVDTIQLARKYFLLYSNSLGAVGKFLNVGDKLDSGGWPLWVGIDDDCEKAKKKMTKYCIRDVDQLFKVYKKLLALAKNVPNYNHFFQDEEQRCPNCGSVNLQKRGMRVVKNSVYHRLQCNHCGTWCKSTKKTHNLKPI